MQPLHFTIDWELKPNTTVSLPDEIVADLIAQHVGSGSHITIEDASGTNYDCLVNRIGNGFVFRIIDKKLD